MYKTYTIAASMVIKPREAIAQTGKWKAQLPAAPQSLPSPRHCHLSLQGYSILVSKIRD